PDTDKFPCLTLAPYALNRGGNTACIVNAANEIVNEAFRQGRIRFTDIYPAIMETIEKCQFISAPSLDDYIQSNDEARHIAAELIN
ncbi:MAG: 1-deoxy-D-xylulose-5-phosphate reductoisomerase, partial [Muribaculaceae bacterium]|nr:1-deoxy-D-xylulose-5-phosphate reductoisomerase [Muribaculaceae bacterium]